MAATSTVYNEFRKLLQDGNMTGGPFDYIEDTIKALITTSTYTPNYDTHAVLTDITNELSGNGYARQTLASKTLVKVGTGATAKYAARSSAVSWTASGGAITGRYIVLFKDTGTAATSPLICCILADNTPADVSVPDAGTWTETPDATNGWFYT